VSNNPIDLDQKKPDIEAWAQAAILDESMRQTMLEEIAPSKKHTPRSYNCFLALEKVAETRPELLADHWEEWVAQLKNQKDGERFKAIHFISALAKAPGEERFADILDRFFALLDDPSLPNAGHVAGMAGGIACAKPELIPSITRHLMMVEKTHFDPGRQGLINWYVLESMDQFMHLVKDKGDILKFVRGLLDCPNARLQKRAQAFLKKWG